MHLAKLALASLALALVACGGGGDADWTTHAIKPVSGKIGAVAFTIELPDGMRAKPDDHGVEYDFLVGDYVKTPDITISTGVYAKTLADFQKTEPKVTEWIRAEVLPFGYIAVYENQSYKGKEDYLVHAQLATGDVTLVCDARVTPWSRGATTKDKLPALERICLSMTVAK